MATNNNQKKDSIPIIIIGVIFFLIIASMLSKNTENDLDKIVVNNKDVFRIISSTSTKAMDDEIIDYGKKNGIKIEIEHYGDLEIVDKLNDDSSLYDAVWISNSLWLYQLENSYLVQNSKSIVIDPVVLGITKSKATELGFVDNDNIYNSDILNAIRGGNLKYVMASVTKTNTGATTYLNFLNSLAGRPEVLTEEMLNNEQLVTDLKDLFSGVERVSGDEDYLRQMYLNGDYNAIIDYESSLISLNKELIKKKKEPLYLIYPVDGVALNDMPFGYIVNDSNDTKTKEQFESIQSYLRSDEAIKKMEDKGYRSWYGGTNPDANKKVFNPEWGIDTSKYLKDMKYPSKKVISSAINLYIEALRKPTHVVFCLDVSGSMYGEGLEELQEAMNYILDYKQASEDNLQFSEKDKITIVTFRDEVDEVSDTKYGNETEDVIKYINELEAYGGTNIHDSSIEGLKILKKESDDYTKTIILLTDGYSNNGYYSSLKNYYEKNKLDIPIYSITFGDSDDYQLNDIANLTNAKVFDGKSGLKKAFAEVRSYN